MTITARADRAMSVVRQAADLPVAVAVTMASLIAGRLRPATVLGAFPAAGYLVCDRVVLAVLSRDAVRLPCGLVLATDAAELPVDSLLAAGTTVVVGEGCVRAGGVRLVAARTWSPPTVRAGGARVDVAQLRAAAAMLPAPTLRAETAALADALARGRALDDVVRALVGRGPGLTPSGDDVLAGALLAGRAFGDRHGTLPTSVLGTAVLRHVTGRTTDLSAALLRHAAEGRGAPQAVCLVDVIAGRDCGTGSVEQAMPAVLAIGATSGADLATGIVAGAEAAAGCTGVAA